MRVVWGVSFLRSFFLESCSQGQPTVCLCAHPSAELWAAPQFISTYSLKTLSYYRIWLPGLYSAFHVKEDGRHQLLCLDTVSETIWEGWPHYMKCHWESGFGV